MSCINKKLIFNRLYRESNPEELKIHRNQSINNTSASGSKQNLSSLKTSLASSASRVSEEQIFFQNFNQNVQIKYDPVEREMGKPPIKRRLFEELKKYQQVAVGERRQFEAQRILKSEVKPETILPLSEREQTNSKTIDKQFYLRKVPLEKASNSSRLTLNQSTNQRRSYRKLKQQEKVEPTAGHSLGNLLIPLPIQDPVSSKNSETHRADGGRSGYIKRRQQSHEEIINIDRKLERSEERLKSIRHQLHEIYNSRKNTGKISLIPVNNPSGNYAPYFINRMKQQKSHFLHDENRSRLIIKTSAY